MLHNFPLSVKTQIGHCANALGLFDFDALSKYVEKLPYGKVEGVSDSLSVLKESIGNCNTKHRLLALAARDCGQTEICLVVGIYEMSEANTPGVGGILSANDLLSIPEAHCYLSIAGRRVDFTGIPMGIQSVFNALIDEKYVEPEELDELSAKMHKSVFESWASANGIKAEVAWKIRESCLFALAEKYV
jgi:hypothetical protein